MAPKSPIKVYWDACAWIGLINGEAKKIHPLRSIWEDAQKGKYEIWTSVYSYLEVIKGALEHGTTHHLEESDRTFDNMLDQPYVKKVQLDSEIAKLARHLRRKLQHIGIVPRPDAIHLATASFYSCDELHTSDNCHLLQFDGKVSRMDGNR
jgi:predicted nucleic acid-binding protein